MPYSRTIAAVACIAGLLAVPAATTAAKPKSAKSHVVKTPKGNQLAVPITVRYKLDGKGKSLKRSTLATRVTGAAKLPDGRVLRATETRRTPGKARVRIEHHVFYSVRQTKILRKALAAKQQVKLTVASALQADLDGDGKTDARTTQKTTQVLSAPTAEKSPPAVGHQQGNNPCGVLGLSSSICSNVSVGTWTAGHFWDSKMWNFTCPSAFPYSAGSVSTQTSSKHYTQTAYTTGNADQTTQITIIDDNVRGHPISYTPTAACTTTDTTSGRIP
ncbi:MAG TPA: hypothetical protein VFY44_07890 [Thermoleophilaceae bacterium]|nr:hypothetical protein [Thermoleophilaceae bacterium]